MGMHSSACHRNKRIPKRLICAAQAGKCLRGMWKDCIKADPGWLWR